MKKMLFNVIFILLISILSVNIYLLYNKNENVKLQNKELENRINKLKLENSDIERTISKKDEEIINLNKNLKEDIEEREIWQKAKEKLIKAISS